MDFHNQFMAFTVILLFAQNFALASASVLTYNQLQLKVGNSYLVNSKQVSKIINARDLLLRKAKFSRDCHELLQQGFNESGPYVIKPEPTDKMPPIVVNCKMDGNCGIGWTILHRNSRGSEMTWNETWTTYKYGFGNIQGDHYIGNKYMHFLTTQKWYKARVIINETIDEKYAEYDIFRLGNEDTHYKLRLGTYMGGAGDALANDSIVDNMPFSSRDMDWDGDADNCASKYGGGWWYNTCSSKSPLAILTQKEKIHWEPFCTDCMHVTLMVKPVTMFCRSENVKH